MSDLYNEMSVDVFISYHVSSSKYIADSICHALEEEGVRVWYAPRDVHNFYANDIIDAIKACKIFLLLLNPESSFSEDCLNEIQVGFQRIRDKENMAFLPFQIFPGEISSSAKYYLGRMNWIDAITPPLEYRIDELTQKIKVLLASPDGLQNSFWKTHGDAAYKQEIVQNTTGKIRRYIPISNENFVGREQEFEELLQLLDDKRFAFVSGIGGIGKSEFIRKFAQKYANRYDQVVWTACNTDLKNMIIDGSNLIEGSFARVQINGCPETDEEYAHRKLEYFKSAVTPNTLWIIDNFDHTEDEMLEDLLSTDCKLLITTRSDFSYEGYPQLILSALAEEDLLRLFTNYYKGRMTPEDREALSELFVITEGHTLAVELLGKIAASRHLSPAKLAAQYHKNGLTVMLSERVRNGKAGYSSAFEFVKNLFSAEKLSEEDKNILLHMTMLPLEGFYYTEFAELAGIDDYEAIDELIRKSWIKFDPGFELLSMHPLIREVVLETIPADQEYFSAYIQNLGTRTENAWFMTYEEKVNLSPLVTRVFERFPDITWDLKEAYRFMAFLMVRLECHGQVEDIVNKYVQIHIDRYGEEAQETLLPRQYLADFYNYWYQVDRASEILEETIRIAKKCAPDSRETAVVEKYLSWIYMGDHVKQEFVEELLNDCARIFDVLYPHSKEEADIASLDAAKATLYSQMGRYEEGLAAADRSYKVFYKIGGEENANTLAPMAIKSLLLAQSGCAEEGVALMNRVISIQIKLFGEKHQKVIARYETMGRIYMVSGDKENAVCWLNKWRDALIEKNEINSKEYRRCEQLLSQLQ